MRPLKDYSRVTAEDIRTIKGNLRRAFAKSDLRKAVIEAAVVEHSDPSRPRVKTWCWCALGKHPEAKSYMEVDHIVPYVPIESHFEDMPIEDVIDRMWCDPSNLQVVCSTCHDVKSKAEKALRKPYAKPRKKKACAKV